MSDLAEQHEIGKSADITLEESAKVEGSVTNSGAEVEAEVKEQGVEVKEQEVEAEENVRGPSSSLSEEKKADLAGASELKTNEFVVGESLEVPSEKESQTAGETAQVEQPEAADTRVEGGDATVSTVEEVKQPVMETLPTSNDPVSTNVSADPSPAISLAALRPLSPSSRTSTPPLTATTTAPAAKKFSAMNVNKKFLSKTGSPSPAGAAVATKLNPLANRPISSPVPIAAPSRLLSTTLTTVTSKPSVSPQPPTSASTSSPWAKPVLPASDPSSSGLHQPVPNKRGTPFPSAVPMGSGQGIAAKPAWRAVGADGRRAGMSVNRDFPTASEVAEGKRAAASSAQAHAEAQAAQAEALMKGLNAFTNFEPGAHRWDDEDDEDDIIDFGDGGAVSSQPSQPAPPRPAPTDQPVTKSERFVEDFDRSWPRSGPAPIEERPNATDPRKRESDRVLFNASSNRLEPKAARPAPPQPQPTKLMSRPEPPSTDRIIPGRAPSGRQLPPHLADVPDKGRALPPHMANAPDRPVQDAGRAAWGPRDQGRQAPPHGASRSDLPLQSAVFDDSRTSNQNSGYAKQPQAPVRPTGERVVSGHQPSPTPAVIPNRDIGDSQAAEMHTAAEKARLRRQAEEEERRAAADRAKLKAKELEAKYGPKPPKPQAEVSIPAPPPTQKPPMATAPSYTIAQRPKPQTEVSQPVHSGPPAHAPTGPSNPNLPSRPSVGEASRPRDDQWRNKPDRPRPNNTTQVPPREDQQNRAAVPRTRPARATAEAFFEEPKHAQSPQATVNNVEDAAQVAPIVHLPGMPREAPQDHSGKKDEMIDDMLARIKAAMGDRPEETTPQSRPDASQPKSGQSDKTAPTQPAPPAAPLQPVSAFFDVTEPEVPRSPPPAWRTYTVKLPKDSRDVPELSHSQRLALSRKLPAPRGWLMTYNPPLDLDPVTLSVTDFLLSPPGVKAGMHQKPAATPVPLVSIPQNSYVPYVKNPKAGPSSYHGRSTEHAPTAIDEKRSRPAQQAAPSRAGLADRWRIQETPKASAPEPSVTQNKVDLLDAPPPPKAKTPAKNPARPNAAARFEGLAIGADGSAEPDLKSGVRFMVSSELEGDSLLDEVNKMSLDSVEETEAGAGANGTGQEPRSPSQHGLPSGSLARTHPSSPNGLPPWSNQREHLKQVWEQSSGPAGESKVSTGTPGSDSTPASAYPSANAPSATDIASPQQTAYASQAYSPTSNAFQVRYPAGVPQHAMSQSHQSAENLAGMSYSTVPKHGSSANGYPANGYTGMSQQGLWSTPGFGSSMASPNYGYAAKPSANPLDQKAAMAFNSAGGSKDMAQYAYSSMTSPQHYARSPYGSYSPSYTSQQAQQMQHHQQQQQRMVSSTNGAFGYAGYSGPANHTTRGSSMSGRFAHPQANGSEDYSGYGGQEGYYSQSGQGTHNGGSYQPSSVAGAGENTAGQGGQTSYHAGGSRRKMW